ncbi:ParM/StbA family protein (plasmid) [Alteromonas macleodii]
MSFLALDVGSGLTKYLAGKDQCGVIESAVGAVSDENAFIMGVPDHLQIQVGNKNYLTGIGALNNLDESKRVVTTKALWCEDRNQLILFYSVVAKLFPNGFDGEMQLVVGLPVSKFTKHHKVHKAMFVGKHSFKTPHAQYTLSIEDSQCAVLPQVVGLHFTNMAISRDKKIDDSHVGYIDPGTHSCGVACITDGTYNSLRSANEKSKGADAGLHKLAMCIKDELKTAYDYDAEQIEILKAFRKGYIQLHGEKQTKINLKDVTERHVHRVYSGVIEEMMEKWKGGKTMTVHVSSGGGEYLIDYVKKFFPHATLMRKSSKTSSTPDPIYDVVKGYAIFGKAKFKDNVTPLTTKKSETA